ncbi:MAG: AMP-binding protein [Myxococcota bacterium]
MSANGAASIAQNCASWISDWATERPTALAWQDEHRRCDYATAENRIQRLASWLSDLEVGPGDRVALWLGNRGALIEALFATARIGAIALPINARLTPAEVAYQLADAQPKVLLAERAWRERRDATLALLGNAPPALIEVGVRELVPVARQDPDPYEIGIEAYPASSAIHPVHPEDPMILMYTSGTTGQPKGALLPHRKTQFNCLNAEVYFEIDSADRVLVVAPLFHSLGLQILALPALFKGAGLVLQEGFSASRVWQAIESEAVTYYGGVPTMHQRMLDALDRGDPVSTPPRSLRFAFTAGAAAPPEMIRSFLDRGLLLKQGYGQTETSTLTCLDGELAAAKAGSVGRPVQHVRLRLIDPATIDGAVHDWRDVPAGDVGEIVAKGPITMLGYWQQPEATAETLREGWLRTGDLATRDGDFDLKLVGRAREMYISGGENVYPAEIEAVLLSHPDIEEVAVVAIPDATWGEVGRAHIVLRDAKTMVPDDLLEWLSTRLARYKQPSQVVVETSLPRTASGKIQKHRL